MELRKLRVYDIAALIEESKVAFLPSATNPTQTTIDLFEKLKDVPGFQPYGYVMGDKPISYIVALGHKNPSMISIGPMYVAKEYRGKGLGLKQVSDFIAQAKRDKYHSVYTKTWSKNAASRKIFETIGFEVYGIKQNDRANGDSTIEYTVQC